jgi:quercetin dioxygenase-like cupin family protein
MAQTSRLRRFLGLLYVCVFFAVSAAWILHAQQKQQNSNFQGNVTTLEENPQARASHYRFDAGARTKWHRHEKGQFLLVEDGLGRTQLEGKGVQVLRAGDSTYAPPGVPHWHGASPQQAATIFAVSRGQTTWMGEVSDKDYAAAAK